MLPGGHMIRLEEDGMNKTGGEEALLLKRQLCFPLYAAARRVVGLYTPALKPLGITYTQYLLMLVLWEEEEITMGSLCERLALDSGTLTPVAKKLEVMGLLSRRRSAEDERVVVLSLTEAGRALKDEARRVPKTVGVCLPLSPEEAGQLYALLYKLLDGLKESDD